MIDTTPFKTRLLEDLRLVTKELETLGVQNPEVASDWIPVANDTEGAEADHNVLADKYEDLVTREGIVAELETRFNNITRALKKIEDGTYGICELSGDPIELERLNANPAARTCIAHREQESNLPQ